MLRKTTSLTALLSFLLLTVTSVILYILPAGRVAYWANYRLWGLTKEDWGALHLNLGALFILAIVIHTCLNWGTVMSYLKDRSTGAKRLTREFGLALLMILGVSLGTYAQLPPFSTLVGLGTWFSAEAARVYGEPPYGHAELSSLATFIRRMELDSELSRQRLAASGIRFYSTNQTLKELAIANQVAPKDIYLILSPPEDRGRGNFPKEPPPGLGKRPMAELCQDYAINCQSVLTILEGENIRAREEMSLKQIAAEAGKNPHTIYDLIRERL